MTELLENSDNTNADTKVSESPSNEATISLSTVQALADALQKIESYTPTVWVDNESPDIDAAHLNKAEQAIMRVTTAMNSAVDVIKDLQSQVNTTNNNLSNKADKTSLLSYALKSDLASTDITPTPISGLVFSPATMSKKAGVAYLNLEISNTTSSAISMENGKVIATGFPIPYKKQQVYVEAIPWNNGATGSNASTTPLRLCIDNTGRLCSYYPSGNEKITPGMPICINMAYPINE